jgi:hypothetical protein
MPIKLSTTAQKESNAVKLKVATNQILRKNKNIVTIIAIIISMSFHDELYLPL